MLPHRVLYHLQTEYKTFVLDHGGFDIFVVGTNDDNMYDMVHLLLPLLPFAFAAFCGRGRFQTEEDVQVK